MTRLISSRHRLLATLLLSLALQAQAAQDTTWQYQYDANGNRTHATDPLGRTTVHSYDALNRRITSTDPSGGVTRFSYDGQDRLTAVTDPRGLTTRHTIDGLGNLTQTVSPDSGTTSYTHDEVGNVVTRTDARGLTTRYRYDALNRLVATTHADGSAIAYTYDQGDYAIGYLSGMSDPSGQTAYGYDRRSRVASATHTLGNGSATRVYTVSYGYGSSGTATGHRTSLTYPSGNRIELAYDEAGRISSLTVTPTGTTTAIPLLSGIGYTPFGPATSWTWGNSSATSQHTYAIGRDLDGRTISYPLGHALTEGVQRTLGYDAASHLTSIRHGSQSQLDQAFGYDQLDRLTSASGGISYGYQYDANSNRTSLTVDTASYTNVIDASSNRLLSTSGPLPARTHTYDAAGNLTGDGVNSYSYGANGRLASATVAGGTVSYLYNGLGQRVRKTGPGSVVAGGQLDYVYDDQGRLLGEYDAAGRVIQETVYLGEVPVAVLKQTLTGTRRTQTATTSIYYVYADQVNTPRMITRASDNKMVWRWDQADPFGMQGPDENPAGAGTFSYNPRFPGQIYDKETGLFQNYYRDYDPATGRYVQSDPIGLAAGPNTYAYVEGNPLTGYDSLGLANSGWKPSPGLSDLKMPPDPLPILIDTYNEMQEKNVPGTDQFFHCMATCRARKNGSTPPVIKSYTDMKEGSDYMRNLVGKYGKRVKLPHEEMMEDIRKDQAVNDYGMSCPDNESCEQRCKPYIDMLLPKYRTYMKEYLPK